MNLLTITEYTDPTCPFAWSAEPSRRRLDWLYGAQLIWETRMVGLSGGSGTDHGLTPERQAVAFRQLAEKHHMPMDSSIRPRMAVSLPACRAVVAVRRHRPDRERAILRALRVLHFAGSMVDEPATLAAAAQAAGLVAPDLEAWMAEAETELALDDDLTASRRPSPAARALSHKLATTDDGGHRYTCPSYELTSAGGRSLAAPGFQPLAAYELAVANLIPDAERRADPSSVSEVLSWAAEPLATAEVAAVSGLTLDDARERLGAIAVEEHMGFDGLWRLPAAESGWSGPTHD